MLKHLLHDRNIGMADKIEELLKTSQTAFVMPGAAHLVGEDGLIKMLQDRGYQVEQVTGT
jgi:uncharacterized protein YbaP (TraB family)